MKMFFSFEFEGERDENCDDVQSIIKGMMPVGTGELTANPEEFINYLQEENEYIQNDINNSSNKSNKSNKNNNNKNR